MNIETEYLSYVATNTDLTAYVLNLYHLHIGRQGFTTLKLVTAEHIAWRPSISAEQWRVLHTVASGSP